MSEPSDDVTNEIRDLLARGQKLQAVKFYKASQETSLLEAKNAVEAIEAELKASTPDSPLVSSKTGCAGAIVLLILPVTLAAAYLVS
ncbi:ribosomal protein L7/L12 [Rhodopirellula rubra]|uniref:Ribosomal protein L7/L12 n=1 Tax=Aporhodopirellula rubra TaxID=980271 RepID=A0A7W5E4G6_9BACT|nr:hypothetical protein [Aporhodopirellula rubra]MBB3209970.1 ribosomal protein L7/L12 [Aporhodopirellula rubra]